MFCSNCSSSCFRVSTPAFESWALSVAQQAACLKSHHEFSRLMWEWNRNYWVFVVVCLFCFYYQEVLFNKWNSEVRVLLIWYMVSQSQYTVLWNLALRLGWVSHQFIITDTQCYACVYIYKYVHQHQTLCMWKGRSMFHSKCSCQSHHFRSLRVDASNFLVWTSISAVLCLIRILFMPLFCSVSSHWLWTCILIKWLQIMIFSFVRSLHLMHCPERAMCKSFSLYEELTTWKRLLWT